MQGELEAEAPGDVALLGVNLKGLESGNEGMCDGRTLAWLQDVPAVDAWTLWDVTTRDVVVLDRFGRAFAIYNLTVHDLANPGNYAALKQLLLDAAAAPP